jgi:hypothetical protein
MIDGQGVVGFVEVPVERIRPGGGLALDVLLVAFAGGPLQVLVGALDFV